MAALGRTAIPPPLPGQSVPKEYVRQQLNKLGLHNVTEEEIESYAADLTSLIRVNLVDKADVSGSGEDSSETTTTPQSIPLTETYSSNYSSPYQHGGASASAVFKTFPGDKENRVHFLSPLSPSPLRGQGSDPTKGTAMVVSSSGYEDSPVSSNQSIEGREEVRQRQRVFVKRKVLRDTNNGGSKVIDESFSELESEEKPLARYLSDLSLTSLTSTADTAEMSGVHSYHLPGSREKTSCCKSFIRPATTHPHNRGLRKCDPVNRYHEFREMWENFKPPGERSRNALRWQIREQLMHQDVPYYEPQRRVYKPNSFVVPTEKKRSALRWEVRHTLAHH